jgi:hypothetical protein
LPAEHSAPCHPPPETGRGRPLSRPGPARPGHQRSDAAGYRCAMHPACAHRGASMAGAYGAPMPGRALSPPRR